MDEQKREKTVEEEIAASPFDDNMKQQLLLTVKKERQEFVHKISGNAKRNESVFDSFFRIWLHTLLAPQDKSEIEQLKNECIRKIRSEMNE